MGFPRERFRGRSGPSRQWRRVVGNQRGVALLVEVLVAALIMSIAIIPILFGLTAVFMSLEKTMGVTVATGFLQEQAEVLKAAGYQYIPVGEVLVGDNEGEICYDTGFVVVQDVELWDQMSSPGDVETGDPETPVVKRITLSIYRKPYVAGESDTLATWEFIIYDGGI